MNDKNILIVIPARGGSKGIPKKNIRIIDNKPLISYSINVAKNCGYNADVVVSTDDDEIERISKIYGATIIKRTDSLALDNITLDPVIYDATLQAENKFNKKYDVVITMQPTSPLLTVATLDKAIAYFLNGEYDTIISVVNNPHLAWGDRDGKIVPLYKERLNRQLLPKHYLETGAFLIANRSSVNEHSRLGDRINVFEIGLDESIDIDTMHDWWIAEKELQKKNILIRIEGYNDIGTGHVFRGLSLAYNLTGHNVKFVLSEKSDIGIRKIKESFFPYSVIKHDDDILNIIKDFNCDILINDMLNTSVEYIKKCKGAVDKVVNFEDLGAGGEYADIVINDLYDKVNDYSNTFWGSKYYCIRDEFLLADIGTFNEHVKEILVSFGGTDPSNLSKKILECVDGVQQHNDVHFTFVVGIGYHNLDELIRLSDGKKIDIIQNVPYMTDLMSKADIAICSQGRTMLELAKMGVPTILLAQNEREQNHEFGYIKNGFINLGLGELVEKQTIISSINWLIDTPQIRKQIREQMLQLDLVNGMKRVINLILN